MADLNSALKRSDFQEIQELHRELEVLGGRAAVPTDALAKVVEAKMAYAHEEATGIAPEYLNRFLQSEREAPDLVFPLCRAPSEPTTHRSRFLAATGAVQCSG